MNFEKERMEALAAGHNALASLENAKKMLSGARGWGIYDTLFRGGLISGLVKHSKMKQAGECIEQAKQDLRRFNSELHDLDLHQINLSTNDLLGLSDIFFDGFLSDFLMQNRIKEAITQVDMAIAKVRSLLYQLENNRRY